MDDVIKDTDRGASGQRAKDTDRSNASRDKDTDRGGGTNGNGNGNLPFDIFQRASQLGGFFVVAFVAPMGGARGGESGQSVKQEALIDMLQDRLKDRGPRDEPPAAGNKPGRSRNAAGAAPAGHAPVTKQKKAQYPR
jgi:hypothetical protein